MIVTILSPILHTEESTYAITKIVPLLIGGIGGSILTILYNKYNNSVQKMTCHYIDDDVIAKIPVVTEKGEHQNVHTKEFKLINSTNKDISLFRIVFEFDAQSTILKHDTFCKIGKNIHKAKLLKPNECSFIIKNFNRGDESKFNFDIANLNQDIFNVTEADCIGFKILVRDKRKTHKKEHGKIVRKEDIK